MPTQPMLMGGGGICGRDLHCHRAVEIGGSRDIDIRPVVTGSCPRTDGLAAIDAAGELSRAVKAQIAFAEPRGGGRQRVGARFSPRQDASE